MKKTKRILAALLSLCMMTVLSPSNIAFAQAAATVKVGSSVELSNTSPFALTDASGNVTTSNANELNWNVKFESGKLTLKNAIIKTAYSYFNGFAAIYAENDLTIELIGTNEIDVSGRRCHGISCAGNLIIQGSDSLTAITTGFESSPIFTNEGNVELNSGTLYLTGDDDSSSGIYAYNGDVNISGGTITAYGKGTRSNGIGATGNITVTGGTITAMATNMAFNKAPDLEGYRYTSTVSESITGTPTVNYIASDIAKYKYIKFENLETEKGIFAGRYSYRQVFDCQRNPSSPTQLQAGEQFKVSGFDLPMNAAASAASMIRFKENEIADKVFYFKKTNNNSAPFSMYMANDVSGTDETLVSVKGNIYGLGAKGFLYISNDDGYGNNLGYFITNEDGYKYGDGFTYTPDITGPISKEQGDTYIGVNPAPENKVKETTPDVQLSINTMKLTPVSERMQYSVDGGLVWLDVPADATISGVTLENGVYVKKLGDGVTTIDSNPQIIKIVKETPTVETKPQFGSLKVNNSLSSLTITGGVVKGTEDSIIKGVYTWKTPDDIMSDVGEFDKIIVFTPENNFYNDIEIPVQVTVYKTSSGGGTTRYIVKYNTNGGNAISSSSVTRNSVLKKPTEPIKEGYTFDGWYTDSTLAAKYDFTAKVTKAFTLYAKWTEKSVDNSKNEIILIIGDKTAIVFGESKKNDVAPKIVNDRTMLPARFVAENLGAKVEWDEKTQKVTITK